jgi:hypothetical protein
MRGVLTCTESRFQRGSAVAVSSCWFVALIAVYCESDCSLNLVRAVHFLTQNSALNCESRLSTRTSRRRSQSRPASESRPASVYPTVPFFENANVVEEDP